QSVARTLFFPFSRSRARPRNFSRKRRFSTKSHGLVSFAPPDARPKLRKKLTEAQHVSLLPTELIEFQLRVNRRGQLLTEAYPSGHTLTFAYDSAGRISNYSGNLGDGTTRIYTNGITYSEFGGLQQEQFGTQTALYHKLRYNVRGQLYDIRLSTYSLQANELDWNRGCLAFYYGGYAIGQSGAANNGNVTRQDHYAPLNESLTDYGYTQDSYSYDTLNRLAST